MKIHRTTLCKIYLVLILAFLLAPILAFARDAAQVRAFRKDNACPATGKFSGACPGWVADHKWPLCAGGPDTPANLQWQETAASYEKDKLERAVCKRIQWRQ